MKIPLSQQELAGLADASGDIEALATTLADCRIGDWEAKRRLERMFHPLLRVMALKRVGQDTAALNRLVELGREGVHQAAKRFPEREPARHFRVFALPFIEFAMDHRPGFWERLWKRRSGAKRSVTSER